MIHVTRVVDLEVWLANFGLLEDLLLKAKLIGEKTEIWRKCLDAYRFLVVPGQ